MMFIVLLQSRFLSRQVGELLLWVLGTAWSSVNRKADFSMTIASARHRVGFNGTHMTMELMVLCPACGSVYTNKGSNNQKINLASRSESNAAEEFGRTVCDQCRDDLFIHRRNGLVVPRKVVPYSSVIKTIEVMFRRPGFAECINSWRDDPLPAGLKADIHHGDAWRTLKDENGNRFCDHQNSLMLRLGLDWFKAGDGSPYSVGALFIVIDSLPSHLRNNSNNVILVAVLPGPREQTNIQLNHILDRLVDDLEVLYLGKPMAICGMPGLHKVRASLHCISCDLPASFKLSGFMASNAFMACRRCNIRFNARSDTPTQRDFTEHLALSTVPQRNSKEHIQNGILWKNATSSVARSQLENINGSKYSSLMRMSHVGLVERTIFDTMHLLYLGVAKKLLQGWSKKILDPDTFAPVLTKAALDGMAAEIPNIVLPTGFEFHYPSKVANGFSEMKSDEFRVFILALSPLVLLKRLYGVHKEIWLNFYLGNKILAQPVLSDDDIKSVKLHFDLVVQLAAGAYGDVHVPPNYHNMKHMHEDCTLFSGIKNYWCYTLERGNFQLKNVNNNHKLGFEVTLMKNYNERFFAGDFIGSCPPDLFEDPEKRDALETDFDREPVTIGEERLRVLEDTFVGDSSVQYTINHFDTLKFIRDSQDYHVLCTGAEPLPESSYPTFSPKYTGSLLKTDALNSLILFYRSLLVHGSDIEYTLPSVIPVPGSRAIRISPEAFVFNEITLAGQLYRSINSRTQRGTIIKYIEPDGSVLVGQIQYFFQHERQIPSHSTEPVYNTHYMAFCKWYKGANESLSVYDSTNVTILYNYFDSFSVIPVQKIHSCIALYRQNGGSLVTALEVPRKVSTAP
jgi:hypothetical protein